MSEAERKKRLSYKERRKKWIFIQGIALILVAILILASVFIYNQLNKEIYIEYQESSSVKYSVKIPKDAPFYSDYLEEFKQYADENGDLWIPSNFAYPTMAATTIKVNLDYRLNMGTPNVDYEYTYRIYAHPEVIDSASKNKFPMPKTVISESAAPITQNSNNSLAISKPIEIDYHHYDQLVKDFESKMGIRNATENLIITMEVEVIGSSEVFESNAENTHTIRVSVPLNENAFDVNYSTSSGQGGDCKILARKNSGNQHLYRGAAIVLGGVELLMLIVFIAYVYLTRNHDINYSIKVQRLLNNYRSFIQRVVNGFDTEGYQMLEIATFKEMLAIRDTIQLPILMSENTDQTRTQFFIPTNTKILYIFEVRVDNYDELYGAHPEWVDDSLIKLDSLRDNDVKEIKLPDTDTVVPAAETAAEVEKDQQNQIILNLYSEIEKLRQELEASKEQERESSPTVAPQVVSAPYVASPVKFGHFTAGGNVTINYHEMPDAQAIREAAKILSDNRGEPCSEKDNENPEASPEAENTLEDVSVVDTYVEEVPAESEEALTEENTVCSCEEANEATETLADDASLHEEQDVTKALEEAEQTTESNAEDEQAPEAESEDTVEAPAPEEAATEPVAEEVTEAPTYAELEDVSKVAAEEVTEIPEAPEAEEAVAYVEASKEPQGVDIEQVLDSLEFDDDNAYYVDENGNSLKILCRRSFTANIIQSDPETVKSYYSELKNYALSFKGVKARMSWRYEAFKNGRNQLLRMKIRGKSICLYCALDPEQFDKTKYFQETVDAKMFDGVPMLVKIKSARGLKRAKELIDAVMEKFGISKDPKAKAVNYLAEYPFENTKTLVERGLIKILHNDYVIKEPAPHKAPEVDASESAEDSVSAEASFEDGVVDAPVVDAPVAQEPVTEEPSAEMPTENAPTMVEEAESIIENMEEEIPGVEVDFDEAGEIVVPEGKQLSIHCKRSFTANLMQSDPHTIKTYYSELKNYILSFKGVKARSAWRYESYNKGRDQLFRIRIKGKSLCLYCALDPSGVDESRYFHDVATSKDYADVPTMVRIKTTRGLKRAKELVEQVMQRFEIQPNPKAKTVDYLEVYPFRKTAELVEAGYVKILSDSYKIKEPKAPKTHSQLAKK